MDKKQEHLNSKHIDSSEVCPNYMDSNEYNANDIDNMGVKGAKNKGIKETMDEIIEAESNENDNANTQTENSSIEQAYKELEEKYLRTHADFENSKKRLERDKNQALEYAYEKIARDLLPILDTLESAKTAAKEYPAILEGLCLTKDNLLKVLQKHGVEEIEARGEFDPNIHECIMQIANPEVKNGHIAQVMQTGYRYKERTLRPAMVAIAKND